MRAIARFAIPIGFALVAGCQPERPLMPLRLGFTWSYLVRGRFSRFVQPVTVVRRLSVAGCEGYELKGPLGSSLVAWNGDRLVATRINDSEFRPSIPVLAPDAAKRVVWHGRLILFGTEYPAWATLDQKTEDVQLASRKLSAVASALTLHAAGKSIELNSWYSRGVGLVRQEQRTDGRVDLILELLSGPTVE